MSGLITGLLSSLFGTVQSVLTLLTGIITGSVKSFTKPVITPIANGLDTIFKPAFNQFVNSFGSAAAPVCVYTALPLFVAAVTTLWVAFDQGSDTLNPNPITIQIYDFIVVGGGSAGAVLAYRLSTNKNIRVLLIEAGGIPTIVNSIPGAALYAANLPDNNWNYISVPQNNSCFSLINQSMLFTRTKALGGCSDINLMLWVRGNQKDYNNWADLTGDPSWTYDNLLTYFKRSENYEGNFPDPNFHGTGGPVTVSKQAYDPSLNLWLKAGQTNGYTVGDINAYQTQEFTPADVNIKDGKRFGTYWAYLEPVEKNRTNLDIVKFATATKVIIENNVAVGVQYFRNGKTVTAKASKEVILSAGTFNSAKLLMQSGVGPADHLQNLGIPLIKNLPGVGSNFHDHPSVYLPFIFNSSISFILERNLSAEATFNYFTQGKGPLASNLVPGLWFYSTSYNNDTSWPDIEYHLACFGLFETVDKVLTSFMGLKPDISKAWISQYFPTDGNWVSVQLSKPKSKGTVRLASKNPNDPPVIDPQLFAFEEDVERIVEATQFIVNFIETSPLYNAVNATFIPNPFPDCKSYPFKSYDYFKCLAKSFTATMNHECGTCKMGMTTDSMAVVDPTLKVIGISGLRVADASVMPVVPNGNTNAPTIMIGEKASSMICSYWNITECI